MTLEEAKEELARLDDGVREAARGVELLIARRNLRLAELHIALRVPAGHHLDASLGVVRSEPLR